MHRKIAKGVVLEALVMGRNILSDMVRNIDSNTKIRDIISRFCIGEISPKNATTAFYSQWVCE